MAISYGKPDSRDFHFEREHISMTMKQYILYPVDTETEEQKEEKSHYIYLLKKNEDADRKSEELFQKVLDDLMR